MIKKLIYPLAFSSTIFAQQKNTLSDEMALNLANLPLHCIHTEYPNKTGHTFNTETEVGLSPKDLHPAFYGCYDWHSSVHGHWMLVYLLKNYPALANRNEIIEKINISLTENNLKEEALYFSKYPSAKTFERTYGWAWLLKLDEELSTWNNPLGKKWKKNLLPLTQEIVTKWKDYLPKQTYPNRTGVHPNTAFAIAFAIDWARANNDNDFEKQLIEKAKLFYLNDKNIPAHLEPDGSDFFSTSLNTAYLMTRVLPTKEYEKWLKNFYTKKGWENISKIPFVSDLNDYQTVHLVGLSFSRAWCLKGIANHLSNNHKQKKELNLLAEKFIKNGLPLLFKSDYGGSHWLASFAIYAITKN